MNKINKIILIMLLIVGLSLSISSASAATYTLLSNDSEFSYRNSDYSYSVYFNTGLGHVSTFGHNQINYVKITDVNGVTRTLHKNVHFKNSKKTNGYHAYIG